MGKLYVVATPIGNLEDITIRAARILLSSNTIVAESASKVGILLKFLEKQFPEFEKLLERKVLSFPEDEEISKVPQIIKLLEQNDVALISEAGTPLISDPGFLLVREAVKRNIRVVPIPGSNAVISALSASGVPTDKFMYLGFLPKQETKKRQVLQDAHRAKTTIVIFESPHRALSTLKTINDVFGDIDIVIARELTKLHEEIIRDKASNIIGRFSNTRPRGEFVLIFSTRIL